MGVSAFPPQRQRISRSLFSRKIDLSLGRPVHLPFKKNILQEEGASDSLFQPDESISTTKWGDSQIASFQENEAISWPSRSPDLTFLGYVKDTVYVPPSATAVQVFSEQIRAAVTSVPLDLTQQSVDWT